MARVYTVYIWVSKEGCDSDFIVAWQEFAKWLVKQPGSTGSTRLFRDMSDSKHFLSVDSWEDEKALKTLQAGSEFNRKFAGLRRFLDNFSSWPLRLEAQEKV